MLLAFFIALVLLVLLAILPCRPLARKCFRCRKMRHPASWLTSLDKDYCDDCIDAFNEEIRNKKCK